MHDVLESRHQSFQHLATQRSFEPPAVRTLRPPLGAEVVTSPHRWSGVVNPAPGLTPPPQLERSEGSQKGRSNVCLGSDGVVPAKGMGREDGRYVGGIDCSGVVVWFGGMVRPTSSDSREFL